MNKFIALISTVLLLPYPTFALEIASNPSSQPASESSYCQLEAENGEFLSEKQLQSLASKITVKVTGDNNGGSGTLLGKQGNSYLVLTNAHVVRGVNSISLKTADGKSYPAEIVKQTNFEKSDLVLLKFQSSSNYCLVDVIGAVPNKDMAVLAAGFSGEKGEIVFRTGEVKQVLGQSLKEGYQIGYSSDIEQGMSGGPIISSQGMIVGVNGRGAYPILNSGYVYQNGSRPSEAEIQEMRKLSWGIPASTFLAQVNGEILTAYDLPLPANSIEVPQTQLTGWLGELEEKAKKFTVRIDSSKGGNGSGVIIAKDGNTYTVLTAAHVFSKAEDATKPCDDCEYKILAPDGKNKYSIDKSTIKREQGVDLAVVKFASKQNYEIATLADYNPNDNQYIFTAGYPKLTNNSPWLFTMGRIFSKEHGLFARRESIFQKEPDNKDINSSPGFFSNANSTTKAYELVYSNITYGGMSGGAVLDYQGRVIGIHGQVEAKQAKDEKTKDCGVHSFQCHTQIGYSLGIPISTFLALKARFNAKAKKVEENAKPPQLNSQKIESIQQIMLSADVSKGNASASVWLERGNQLWRLGSNEEAIRAFNEVIKLKPSFINLAYYNRGILYKEQKKWDLALADFNQAIKLNPQYPEAYFNRGNLYEYIKKWEFALADYTRAIVINPQYVQAYIYRGILYNDLKKSELALADFNKVIRIHPENVITYNQRGILYNNLKKSELALADFNKAIIIHPQYFDAHFNRGILYTKQEKWDLALVDFNKAIVINSESPQAYGNRGLIYHRKGEKQKAIPDLQRAAQLFQSQGNTAGYEQAMNLLKSLQ